MKYVILLLITVSCSLRGWENYRSLDDFVVAKATPPLQYIAATVCYPIKCFNERKINHSDFEKKLRINGLKECRKDMFDTALFTIDDVRKHPELFLKYIYYIENSDFDPSYKDQPYDRFTHRLFELKWKLDGSPARLAQDLKNSCLNARIDGYSAVGAAVVSRYRDKKRKQKLVQRLLDAGCTLTEKDRALATLKGIELGK